MVVADTRQFPWIAAEFAAVMDPQTERLARCVAYLTLAAHRFMGILNTFSLWPWMMGRERLAVPAKEVVKEAVRIFLRNYRRPRSDEARPDDAA